MMGMNDFASRLLRWYEANRRVLPWREDPTPYHVFLSEIMLQQTRVDTAIAYYERFLLRFPSFAELSEAEEDEVLRLWQGLGYYNRAKNLLKAAKIVQTEWNGILPKQSKSLMELPGVGEYVSRAILAIAYDEKAVAVDGNLLRIYARLNAQKIDVAATKSKKECEAFFLANIEHPSAFNQALMDLGELVCLPHGEPRCGECPFRDCCQGLAAGRPSDYPLPKKKPGPKPVSLTVLLVFDHNGAIAVRKRDDEGLLASMHEFPNLPGHPTLSSIKKSFPSLSGWEKLGKAKHRFSHQEWDMDVYRAEGVLDDALYVPLSELEKRCSLPTAFAKLLSLLD